LVSHIKGAANMRAKSGRNKWKEREIAASGGALATANGRSRGSDRNGNNVTVYATMSAHAVVSKRKLFTRFRDDRTSTPGIIGFRFEAE